MGRTKSTMPKYQANHRHIHKAIKHWLDLHFPADSQYYGRIMLGHRHRGTSGIYNLTRRNIDELQEFVAEMHVSNRLDYYITANSFSGVQRTTEDVFALHNIVIDVDCHGENVVVPPAELAQAFVWLCSRDLWTTGDVPEPNSIVYTGRGVQLWWAINPISSKLEWIYRRIQGWLMDAMGDVVADNADRLKGLQIDRAASGRLAGWYRLPYTYNTGAKRWGRLEMRKFSRYNHQDLLDAIPEDYKPRRGNRVVPERTAAYIPLAPMDPVVLEDGSSLMARRILQMAQLRSLRNAPKGAENRDLFCFIVYCALLADHTAEDAWARLLAFNDGFKDPLKSRELSVMMRSATQKEYRLTNEWIIEALDIAEDEQNALGLHVAGVHEDRARTPNQTRDMIRAAVREDRDNKILALYSAGQSKAAIARELGVARNTVLKVVQLEIEEQESTEAAANAEIDDAVVQAVAGSEYGIAPAERVLKNGAYKYVSYAPYGHGS